MLFLIRETLSFNLIYVAACYLVGTGMCHNMVGLLQHYTPCPEIYCLRLIDEYCENYAEILCVIVYCIGMCLRQNSGQGV